jgi:hypothetical protein
MKIGMFKIIVLILAVMTLFTCSCRVGNNSKTVYSRFISGKVHPNWHSAEFDDSGTVVINWDQFCQQLQ